MNILMSILILFTPVWPLKLKTTKVSPEMQLKLKLKKSLDDRYVVLNFQETKKLLVFKEESLVLSNRLQLSLQLSENLNTSNNLLEKALKAKEKENLLLSQQIGILRKAVKGERATTYTVASISSSLILVTLAAFLFNR